MIEQKESIKEGQGIVVATEAKDREKEANDKKAKQKQQLHHAIVFSLLGLLFGFAPQYIQTNITWIVFTSGFLFSACFAISFYYMHIYIHLLFDDVFKLLNVVVVFCVFCAIACYLIPGSENGLFSDPSFEIELRTVSFLSLLIIVVYLIMRFPDFVAFYERNKATLKSLITVKNIFAAIGAVAVFLTALLQFLQILLQIFHH
jgi:hypothetical protein